jgi:hypothetical protein
MNFVLGPISMNVVFRVELEATALHTVNFDLETLKYVLLF